MSLLGIELSKAHSSPPIGRPLKYADAQQAYAASDVLNLHAIREQSSGNAGSAKAEPSIAAGVLSISCPSALTSILAGWPETDIFSHA